MSRQEESLKGSVSNKTITFETIKERNVKVSNRLASLYPREIETRQTLFAKTLGKKIAKNIRMIRNKKILDSYKVQENQECLLKIIDILWMLFKDPDFFNSKYLEYDASGDLKVESLKKEHEGKYAYYEGTHGKKVAVFQEISKEEIQTYLEDRSSEFLSKDVSCQIIMNKIITQIGKYRGSHIDMTQIFQAVRLAGYEITGAFLESERLADEEEKKVFDDIKNKIIRYYESSSGSTSSEISFEISAENIERQAVIEDTVSRWLNEVGINADASDVVSSVVAQRNVNAGVDNVLNAGIRGEYERNINVDDERDGRPPLGVPIVSQIQLEPEALGPEEEVAAKPLTSLAVGSGVPTSMDLPIQNVVSTHKEIIAAPHNPELVGRDTQSFVSEFQPSITPSAPPLPAVPVSMPTLNIPLKKPTGNVLRDTKKDYIEIIINQLEKMLANKEFVKINNEDMVNLIAKIIREHHMASDVLSSTDLANLVRDFYKKHPESTIETEKIKNSDFKMTPEKSMLERYRNMILWMIRHLRLKLFNDDGSDINGPAITKQVVEKLKLTKPAGSPQSMKKYKWLFNRDLSEIKTNVDDVVINILSRFGIESIKNENEWMTALLGVQTAMAQQAQKADPEKHLRISISEEGVKNLEEHELWPWAIALAFVNYSDIKDVVNLVRPPEGNYNVAQNLSPQQLAESKKRIEDMRLWTRTHIADKETPDTWRARAFISSNAASLALLGAPPDFVGAIASTGAKFSEDQIKELAKFYNDIYLYVAANSSRFSIVGAGSGSDSERIFAKDCRAIGQVTKDSNRIGKPKPKPKSGKGKMIFRNTAEAMNKLSSLIDAYDMGNTGLEVRNQISQIIDMLMKSRKMTKADHKTIYNEYVEQQ